MNIEVDIYLLSRVELLVLISVISRVDDLDTAAFACCNEKIPETVGTIIVGANTANRIIAKDVLLMLWCCGVKMIGVVN